MSTQNTLPAQHTPGPWSHAGLSIYAAPEKRSFGGPLREYLRPISSIEVVEGGDLPEYKVNHGGWNVRTPGDAEAEANARLIAAAPELLEVLQDIMDEAEFGDPSLEIKARAALAKAKGGAA